MVTMLIAIGIIIVVNLIVGPIVGRHLHSVQPVTIKEMDP